MLELKSITKSFRDFKVLEDINITARPGEIYGLVGSNGCGKTTLLKHILQVYRQDSGEVYYKGEIVKEDSELFKDFYYVQDDLFFPFGSTLRTLFEYEKMFYENMSEEKFNKLIKFFSIDSDKKLSTMSKGQKKQAAFVLAMAANPKVLLLDEIVDGLDAVVRRKFWNVLIKEVQENNMIVIISSHALKELDNISDRVGIMHQGKIIKEENMESLRDNLKRIQFAVEGEYEDIQGENFKVLKTVKIGSVYFVTLEGKAEEFEQALREKYKVLIFSELAMNLEEIFITELGGTGYGIEEYDEE
ncbi:MAG: ABC transporter ATP-binding protein [Eubacteriales bacterium]|jgi:ABC-2 type transport system ATP-binding protein|nr:ABC transporter ATP-binding protein [Eubacteriales bacterium]NCC80843.1 ABC transporter ATP-binding protein [Clostridia bacterium]